MGARSAIDSAKQSLFPVAHIIINSATMGERTIDFDCMIVFASIVDDSKTNQKDSFAFYGNNNLHDVYNAMLAEANILSQQMIRGELFSNHTQITAAPTAEPFAETFTNRNLAGWLLSFTASVPNNEICV